MASENNQRELNDGFIKNNHAVGIGILWDKKIHGDFPSDLKSQWIVMDTQDPSSFWTDGEDLINFYKYHIQKKYTHDHETNHEIYKNYKGIIENDKYYSIDIYKIYYKPTFETVGVKKTFWIKIIQRRWKKLYRERLNMINKRKSIESLKYRQIHGDWPLGMKVLPSIKDIINF